MQVAESVLAVLVAVLLAVLVVPMSGGRVVRARVQRFALREALVVTPDNGTMIINYLATTRRWRMAGLLIGGAGGFAWSLPSGRGSISGEALFVGWFVGALAAEWRVSTVAAGSWRAAHLVPRERAQYLSPVARILPWLLVAFGGVIAIVDVIGGVTGHHQVWTWLVPAVAAGAVDLLVVYAVQRHVLNRPQPLLPPDQLAADTAIRRRSIRVLAGSGVAGAGIPAGVLVGAIHVAFPSIDGPTVTGLGIVLGMTAAIAGWVIGRAPVRAETSQPATTYALL